MVSSHIGRVRHGSLSRRILGRKRRHHHRRRAGIVVDIRWVDDTEHTLLAMSGGTAVEKGGVSVVNHLSD